MMITRTFHDLAAHLKPGKVLVILGPRQVGKTTLLKDFLSRTSLKYRFDVGDLLNIQEILSSQDLSLLKAYVGDNQLIAVDEAQKIPNIGLNLKILVDQMPHLSIIVTGSSSFDLLGQLGEPLVGRKTTLYLYPLAQSELKSYLNPLELKDRLEEWLIFGGYPAVVTAKLAAEKIKLLEELTQGYLLKDILELDRVKSSRVLMDLLIMLALQVGSEVSLSDLAQKLGIETRTVMRYLDLFEKSFIVFNLRGFSRNLRNEMTKKGKYYFYDNGVRNSLISNFNSLNKRSDVGALWENFLVVERLKHQSYKPIYANNYFWRTWEKQEIDWVEERDGKVFGYEFKYTQNKVSIPSQWKEAYPNAGFNLITKDNYLDFIS